MRTDASALLKENWPDSVYQSQAWQEMQRGRTNQFCIMASGLERLTQKESFTPNQTSTFTSRIESWCLNLSSRDAKRLSASYWIFMVLSCITFFTSHWSIFLAFLIPALVLNHLRVLRKVWRIASTSRSGVSTNGT